MSTILQRNALRAIDGKRGGLGPWRGVSGALLVLACSSEPPSSDGGSGPATGSVSSTGGMASSTSSASSSSASSSSASGGATGQAATTQGASTASATTADVASTSAGGTSTGTQASTGVAGMGGSEGGATSNVSSAGGAGGSTTTSGTNGASAGNCTASTLSSGDEGRSVDVGGTQRSFILHVPASYDGMTPMPLVLDFHGLGGSGMQQASSSGYRQVADQEGFIIAFPDGLDSAWNIGPCCTNSRDVDDVGFAKAMVESIASDGCVDLKRVYSVGFSMGGGMSHFLACQAADVFAAVAPAAFDLLDPQEPPCIPSRPVSVLSFRGTADSVVPFEGGPGSSGRVTFLGAEQTLERWSEINGCMAPATTNGDCTMYEQCDAGVQVGLCVQQGGGHAPGDASRGWAFLSQFALP